jgi:hypothetical protein
MTAPPSSRFIRACWPRVEILLRADSGFARDALMCWCEANRVDYVFGLARNERLVGAIADDLAVAEAESLAQGGAARRFADFAWRTLDSWSRERRVVAKAEPLPQGGEPALRRHVARSRRDRRPHPGRGRLLRPRPSRKPMRLGMIGYGTIGREVAAAWHHKIAARISGVTWCCDRPRPTPA